jgi:hypothetical protein
LTFLILLPFFVLLPSVQICWLQIIASTFFLVWPSIF